VVFFEKKGRHKVDAPPGESTHGRPAKVDVGSPPFVLLAVVPDFFCLFGSLKKLAE
jgi:hypothetical protein